MVRPRLVEEGKPLSTSPIGVGRRRPDEDDAADVVMEQDSFDPPPGHDHDDTSLPPHRDSSRRPPQILLRHPHREHNYPYYYASSAPPGDRSRPEEERAGPPESRSGGLPPPMTSSSSSSLLRAVSRIPEGRRHPHDPHLGPRHEAHSYYRTVIGGGENHRGGNGDDNDDDNDDDCGTTRAVAMPPLPSDRTPREESAVAPDRLLPRSTVAAAVAAAASLPPFGGAPSHHYDDDDDDGGGSHFHDDGGRRAAAASGPTTTTTSRTVRGPHPTRYEIGPRAVEEEGRHGRHGGGGGGEVEDDTDHSMILDEDDDDRGGSPGDVGRDARLRGTSRHEQPTGLPLLHMEPPARMEGVEDHSLPAPLVVMDGANVAYEYGGAASTTGGDHKGIGKKSGTADPKGILVACEYFVRQGIRVKVVLPASWFRRKPNASDPNQSNAAMETDAHDVLAELRNRGLLVASPPADDDDAYAIALARRESSRLAQRCHDLDLGGQFGETTMDPSLSFPMATLGGAFVLSNDMFRDAQHRDPTLRSWLTAGTRRDGSGGRDGAAATSRSGSSSLSLSSTTTTCPGRISYTFADVGALDDHGDPQLDFLPNPRHPLVQWIEERNRSNLR